MGTKSSFSSRAEFLNSEAFHHNLSVLRGLGTLGNMFFRALSMSTPYGGVHYLEVLVDPCTGQIVEILFPNPIRHYEKEIVDRDGKRHMSSLSLSETNPSARLAILLMSAHFPHHGVDVIARDEITPEGRASLYEAVRASQGNEELKKVA